MSEQNLAILIADLSGYTALTEAHGAHAAADVVEQFEMLVEKSLTGKSTLHQKIGDEIVIISPDASDLVTTAMLMLQYCKQQPNFPHVHGGIHFGKLLNRNGNFFGTAINTAARIASHAEAGQICCSHDFIHNLDEELHQNFTLKGNFNFKNLSAAIGIYQLIPGSENDLHIDPVCRMLINNHREALVDPSGEVYFCSQHCLDVFIKSGGKST